MIATRSDGNARKDDVELGWNHSPTEVHTWEHVVGLTLILLSCIFFAVTAPGPRSLGSKNTPHGHMSIDGSSEDFFNATVQTMDSRGLGVGQAEYFLISRDGSTVQFGKVSDIYGYNMADPDVNCSFRDNDRDGRISGGDMFQLRGTGIGGICGNGFILTIKFTENDEVVMKQQMPLKDR